MFKTTASYNLAGNLTNQSDDSTIAAAARSTGASYAQLGQIYSAATWGTVPGSDGYMYYACQSYSQDALGNTLFSGSYMSYSTPCYSVDTTATYSYSSTSGRLLRTRGVITVAPYAVQMNTYDAAGNLQFTYSDSLPTTRGYFPAQDRYTYYSADEHIAASDARWAGAWNYGGTNTFDSLQTVFEEYRYDALGRRVVVRSRKYCALATGLGTACKLGSIRRTVWDGNQELHEITMPGDNGDAASEMENDTLAITRAFAQQDSTAGAFDARSLFGRVLYVFGSSTDQPEAIIRSNAVTSIASGGFATPYTFRPRTIIPLYDMSGSFVTGLFAETGTMKDTTTDGYGLRALVTPSAGAQTVFGGAIDTLSNAFGTLLTGKRDDAGTLYRRYRSYDPVIGRFTQEDPISLAGGLNSYAYAGGDPVNYNDPSGLDATCMQCGGGDSMSPFPGFVAPEFCYMMQDEDAEKESGDPAEAASSDCPSGGQSGPAGPAPGGTQTISAPSMSACISSGIRAGISLIQDLSFGAAVGAAVVGAASAGVPAATTAGLAAAAGFMTSGIAKAGHRVEHIVNEFVKDYAKDEVLGGDPESAWSKALNTVLTIPGSSFTDVPRAVNACAGALRQ